MVCATDLIRFMYRQIRPISLSPDWAQLVVACWANLSPAREGVVHYVWPFR